MERYVRLRNTRIITVGVRGFAHAGKFGDIIYALPAIRALGGGVVWLHDWAAASGMTMTREAVKIIEPLLVAQPYIFDVQWCRTQPSHAVNVNAFRWRWGELPHDATLAHRVLHCFGLPAGECQRVWLYVDRACPTAPVVIARSARYRNPRFPWRAVLRKYNDRCVFVGTPDEHRDFCREFGSLPLARTANLLEVARVIAGAQLFIGNQSSPRAIAEGLKSRVVQEVCAEHPNCCFQRPGEINISEDRADLLPEV